MILQYMILYIFLLQRFMKLPYLQKIKEYYHAGVDLHSSSILKNSGCFKKNCCQRSYFSIRKEDTILILFILIHIEKICDYSISRNTLIDVFFPLFQKTLSHHIFLQACFLIILLSDATLISNPSQVQSLSWIKKLLWSRSFYLSS